MEVCGQCEKKKIPSHSCDKCGLLCGECAYCHTTQKIFNDHVCKMELGRIGKLELYRHRDIEININKNRTVERLRADGRSEEDYIYVRDKDRVSICDGHSGSNIVSSSFGQKFFSEFGSVIYSHTEERRKERFFDYFKTSSEEYSNKIAGSCFIAVLGIREGVIYLGNLGDSSAVLVGKGGNHERINELHNTSNKKEVERIRSIDPKLIKEKPGRTTRILTRKEEGYEGGLSVTRSVGDWSYKPHVSDVPDYYEHPYDLEKYQYLIMGSDGLFDFIRHDELYDIYTNHGIIGLFRKAVTNGSADDISIVVFDLSKYE